MVLRARLQEGGPEAPRPTCSGTFGAWCCRRPLSWAGIAAAASRRAQIALDVDEVRTHRLPRPVAVAVLDRVDDRLVLAEAVVFGGGALPIGPQPPPGHCAAHGVQRVEEDKQQIVLGRLADCPVEPTVP